MSYKVTATLAAAMLNALKAGLDGGRLYIFAGAAPASPDAALDMVGMHTQVAALSVGGDDVTGLTFDTATGDLLPKNGTESWDATIALDGSDAGPTVTPTFFRFCEVGDTGRDAAVSLRLQGTVGGPASTADLKLGASTVTDNGTNTVGVAICNVRLSSLG